MSTLAREGTPHSVSMHATAGEVARGDSATANQVRCRRHEICMTCSDQQSGGHLDESTPQAALQTDSVLFSESESL
jgi:hypothetical protein